MLRDKEVPDKKKYLRYDDDVVRQYRRYLSIEDATVKSVLFGDFGQNLNLRYIILTEHIGSSP
jgi:hypothetical protein